jgi:hypothetical protein
MIRLQPARQAQHDGNAQWLSSIDMIAEWRGRRAKSLADLVTKIKLDGCPRPPVQSVAQIRVIPVTSTMPNQDGCSEK